MRQTALAEITPANFPSPASTRKAELDQAGCFAFETVPQAQLNRAGTQESFPRSIQKAFAGAVYQPEFLVLVEGEDRYVDLLHDLLQQRRCLQRVHSLPSKRVRQRVDLTRDFTQRIVIACTAASDGIVTFTQGG